MTPGRVSTAGGAVVLAASQGGFLVLGYLATVLLARAFGPAAYGTYAVVMSVLVWLEESGRHAIPAATVKLAAETTTDRAALERAAVVLNLALAGTVFVLAWASAPWLAARLEIADGAVLLRLAAIDLPVFGAYAACRAIHQGRRNFLRLGLSHLVYALAKCLGVLLLLVAGVSLEHALLVNVAATVAGLAWVLPGIDLHRRGRFRHRVAPLLSASLPMGLYHFVLELRGALVLWTLQVMAHATEERALGIYVAALNIARVPSLVVVTVALVVLPTLARALAVNDAPWARRHLGQALRFGAILYLPAGLLVMAAPEQLLQWVYSSEFAGGGPLLALLAVGEGVRVAHAILGAALAAAGQARHAAIATLATVGPSVATLVLLVLLWGAIGAALASALTVLGSSLVLGRLVWRRFGALMTARSARNLVLAGGLMTLGFALSSTAGAGIAPSCAVALATYVTALIVSRELTWRDLAALDPWAGTRAA